MSLSIKEFSEMSDLSPQTLRFYHSEGLLVPAEVDGETGYRYYSIEQVATAVLVTALRGAGMSVKDVRRALEAPDTAAALLEEHTGALHRRRGAEDEAIATARALLTAPPAVRRGEAPGRRSCRGPFPRSPWSGERADPTSTTGTRSPEPSRPRWRSSAPWPPNTAPPSRAPPGSPGPGRPPSRGRGHSPRRARTGWPRSRSPRGRGAGGPGRGGRGAGLRGP
ncbi:MerR family transcriptional regulator [Nocardiopsis sp. ARC36]